MAKKITVTRNRNYDPSYLYYGFISQTKGNSIVPLCVLCNKTFTNALMKPSTLKIHLDNSHFEHNDKPTEFSSEGVLHWQHRKNDT